MKGQNRLFFLFTLNSLFLFLWRVVGIIFFWLFGWFSSKLQMYMRNMRNNLAMLQIIVLPHLHLQIWNTGILGEDWLSSKILTCGEKCFTYVLKEVRWFMLQMEHYKENFPYHRRNNKSKNISDSKKLY